MRKNTSHIIVYIIAFFFPNAISTTLYANNNKYEQFFLLIDSAIANHEEYEFMLELNIIDLKNQLNRVSDLHYEKTLLSPIKVAISCIMMLILASCSGGGNINPANLSVEHMNNPTVIDLTSPRLSWVNYLKFDQIRGEYQKAYQINVASSKEKLLKGDADIWDSGKITSSDSHTSSRTRVRH